MGRFFIDSIETSSWSESGRTLNLIFYILKKFYSKQKLGTMGNMYGNMTHGQVCNFMISQKYLVMT